MNEEKKTEVDNTKQIPREADEIDNGDFDLNNVIPDMNKPSKEDEDKCIIDDTTLINIYDEILKNARTDRKTVEDIQANFIDMVMNDGDSSSAAKEAVVNLMKIKTDLSDKMTKVADLMTRIKLKEKDTFPRYLAQQQNNKITITGQEKRNMLKDLESKKGKK